jgi:hypothetical protein
LSFLFLQLCGNCTGIAAGARDCQVGPAPRDHPLAAKQRAVRIQRADVTCERFGRFETVHHAAKMIGAETGPPISADNVRLD